MPNQILKFCFAALNASNFFPYLAQSDKNISPFEKHLTTCNATTIECAPHSFSQQAFWSRKIDCVSERGEAICGNLQLFRADQASNVSHAFEACITSMFKKINNDSNSIYPAIVAVAVISFCLLGMYYARKYFHDNRQNDNARQPLLGRRRPAKTSTSLLPRDN